MPLENSRLTAVPFWFATVVFAVIGWIIAFASSCAIQSSTIVGLLLSHLWFVIVFNFFLLLGFIVALASEDGLAKYRFVLLAFSTANIAFVSITAGVVNVRQPASQALGAGLIFLDIVYFLWIFALGSEPGTLAQAYTSNISFEAKQPARAGALSAGVSQTPMTGAQQSYSPNQSTVGGVDFTLRAETLYPYKASPEDPNELSFAQGEILEIADNKGKWWQARNSQGVVGIAPSNYLKLLN